MTTVSNMEQDDYTKYRGKCLQMSKEAVEADPTLTLVRGYYFCPIWNTEEQHWWTVRQDGTIYDPTARQFPSKGNGLYTPFDGTIQCSECGKEVKEKEAVIEGRYAFCSSICLQHFVGIY